VNYAGPPWLADSVAAFGHSCRKKLAGPGEQEASIRAPVDGFLTAVGKQFRLKAVLHDEVRDTQRRVRPDYGVRVNGKITGYLELESPGRGIDSAGFTGHDKQQWERLRDFPNLLYTNGTAWRLYRYGVLGREPVTFGGGELTNAGSSLSAPPELRRRLAPEGQHPLPQRRSTPACVADRHRPDARIHDLSAGRCGCRA
jgi:hypothetical protein